MGILSENLEQSLNDIFRVAHLRRNEFVTVEHLLLGLLDNMEAKQVLEGLNVDMQALREEIEAFIQEHIVVLADDEGETVASVGLQRVIQRAVMHVQAAGKQEVTGAHALVAIFSEKDSHAVYFLNRAGITRLDVITYISHGTLSLPDKSGEQVDTDKHTQKDSDASPLQRYCINLSERALAGKIDPLIGRDDELNRCMHILCRRRKNNPLLVG